jgi:hypothetical protein
VWHSRVALQGGANLGLGLRADDGRPQSVDDDPDVGAGYRPAKVGHPPDEPLQPYRVGRTHRHDDVGLLECGQRCAVPARGGRVEAQLFVLLEREAAVDHRHLRQAAREGPHDLERGGPYLRPALGTGNTGEYTQLRRHLPGVAGQRRQVELAVVGGARRAGQSGRLVEQTEHLGDRSPVCVRVGEQRGSSEHGDLRRNVDRKRRAAR